MIINSAGKRLYLTASEREAFLDAASKTPGHVRSFCETLHFTGCRISEALNLTADSIDLENGSIVFETLKKRKRGVYRSVPVPARLLNTLELVHQIRTSKRLDRRLWDWSRATGWRTIKAVMESAKIKPGPQTSPKGLRHAYGVTAINAGIPLNLLSKWMGHSAMEITSIYANALGDEAKTIADRMWGKN